MTASERAGARRALVVTYDGTDFAGWQIQPGPATVQGTLRAALAKVHGVADEALNLTGAGRTDAGVHASGQVASYVPPTPRSDADLAHALDGLLPESIRVLAIVQVHDDFDPRRSCVEKRYAYRIVTAPTLFPFDARYAWHVRAPLDVAAMNRLAEGLVGEHDFSTFAAAGSPRESHVRELRRLAVVEARGELRVELSANGFLYKMARNLVGYLIDGGSGREIPPPEEALAARDRGVLGKTAPARGLCMTHALYPGDGGEALTVDRLRDGGHG